MPSPTLTPIGFLVALPAEARSLIRRRLPFDSLTKLPSGHWLMVSGTGPTHAQRGVTRLLEQGVSGIISWGCAAALDSGLKPGDVVLPETVLDVDGTGRAADVEWRACFERALAHRVRTISGMLAESPHIVATAAEKLALRTATGAVAADMETGAIARGATARGIPFLAIRAVADSAAMDLPASVTAALDPRGAVRLGALLGKALTHPTEFLALARLGRAFGAAMESLRQTARQAGPGFLIPPPSAGGQLSGTEQR